MSCQAIHHVSIRIHSSRWAARQLIMFVSPGTNLIAWLMYNHLGPTPQILRPSAGSVKELHVWWALFLPTTTNEKEKWRVYWAFYILALIKQSFYYFPQHTIEVTNLGSQSFQLHMSVFEIHDHQTSRLCLLQIQKLLMFYLRSFK